MQLNYARLNPGDGPIPEIIVAADEGIPHLALVANTAAGGANGNFIGVAPGANVFVGGVFDGGETDLQVYNAARLATTDLNLNHSVSLFNNSFDFTLNANGQANGQDNPALYVDWFQNTFDTLFIQAAGNNGINDIGLGDGTNQIGQPGTMFNGIVVGNADGNARRASSSYWVPGDDGTAPDLRGLPHILAPGSNIGDSHSTDSGSSFAAPHVAGTAALLMENGLGLPGAASRNHQAIKSIILNSARKRSINTPENAVPFAEDHADTAAQTSDDDYLNGGVLRVGASPSSGDPTNGTAQWTPTKWSYDGTKFISFNPLDDEQGTGLLDAERALIQMDGGEQFSGNVTPIGWDRSSISSSGFDTREYLLDFSISEGSFITTTLVWDRIVSEENTTPALINGVVDASDTYGFSTMANLDLHIHFQDQLIAESIGVAGALGENVEHLHVPVPNDGNPGDYKIHAHNTAGALTDYGLAWWTAPPPPPPPIPGHYFFNGDLEFKADGINTIFITPERNGLKQPSADANDSGVHFSLGATEDRVPILGPGTYSGGEASGVTTYTFGALGVDEWLTFDPSLNSVAKIGGNDIMMVVPGNMQVGTDMIGAGSINLDIGTTDGTPNATDGTLRIYADGVLSVSNTVGVYQLLLEDGTLNNAGSITSANTSTTDGEFAYELENGQVNLVLGGTGAALRVTGEVELTQTNTYTGITRLSGGALKTTVATGIDAASAGLQFAGGSLVVSTAALNVQLGIGVGEVNFIADDEGFIAGGGWVAGGPDMTLTIDGDAVLKYGDAGWLGSDPESGAILLNASGFATGGINLTNDLDLNSVTPQESNIRPIVVGENVEFSGALKDTGPNRLGPQEERATFLVQGGGSLLLSGDSSDVVEGNQFLGNFTVFETEVVFGTPVYIPEVTWYLLDT